MGEIPLGVLTQTAGAFGRVQGSLSWFVDVWPQLAEWKATIDRLTTFGESMEAARRVTAARSGFTIERVADTALRSRTWRWLCRTGAFCSTTSISRYGLATGW